MPWIVEGGLGLDTRPTSKTKPSANKQIIKETQGRVYDYLLNLLCSGRGRERGGGAIPLLLQAQYHFLVDI